MSQNYIMISGNNSDGTLKSKEEIANEKNEILCRMLDKLPPLHVNVNQVKKLTGSNTK